MATVEIRVFRWKQEDQPRYDRFVLACGSRTTVLDLLEAIRVDHDPTLAYRHSCHHGACGTCAMRINGVERLACLTRVAELLKKDAHIVVEPLKGLPLLTDLVVQMMPFNEKLAALERPYRRVCEGPGLLPDGKGLRLEDCIECGACVSACPVAVTDGAYLGPAVLAAIWRMVEEPRGLNVEPVLDMADGEHGCWRCHAAFECNEVCPAGAQPGNEIMRLRRYLFIRRLKQWLRLS